MKTYFKFFLITLSALAFSCSDEDADATPSNEMIFDGTRIAISNGYFALTSSYNNKTYHEIYFVQDGISLENKGNYDSFAGNGKMFGLTLELPGLNTSLITGNYTMVDKAATYQITSGSWTNLAELRLDGSVAVTKTGNTYSFVFSCKDVNNKVYSVTYTGIPTSARLGA